MRQGSLKDPLPSVSHDTRLFPLVCSFLKTLSCSLAPSQLNLTPLKGGRSAATLYRFQLESATYVLRLFPPHAFLETRQHQIAIATQAGKIGSGPKILFSNQEGLIMEFFSGSPITTADLQETSTLKTFAHTLRHLHTSSAAFPLANSPFERFSLFCNKHNTSLLTPLKTGMQAIEALLNRTPPLLVPCHLDLNLQNILWNKEQFLLVDWVNGGMSDPGFDLATFAVFADLSHTQMECFLSEYLGRPPTEREWNRLLLLLPVRLGVIAAAFFNPSVSLQNTPPPLLSFLNHPDHYSPQEIGQIMFHASLNLLNQDRWKTALSFLQEHSLNPS